MTDLEGLTKAQRKWLLSFKEEWFGGYPIGMSKKTLSGLIDAGLVEVMRPKFFGIVKWRLTSAGAEIAAALRAQKGD